MNKNRILSLLTAAILLGTTVAAPVGEAQAAQQGGKYGDLHGNRFYQYGDSRQQL